MPVEKRKLEANLAIYLKVAEREFSSKNYKSALKSFKNAHEIAKELDLVEEAVKTLDTQAACQEQLGNFEEAISLAIKTVSNYKKSPVGYLRLGKLLRMRKESGEALNVYEIGLIKANKKDPMYKILEKQIKIVGKVSKSTNDDSGNLLSLPVDVLNQICDSLNSESRSTLKNFALTSTSACTIVMRGILRGNIGDSTDLRSLKSSQLITKLFKDHSVLERFNNQSCALNIDSESATLLFLIHLKKVMTSLKCPVRIYNLSIGPIVNITELFEECLRRGLNIQRLRINFMDYNSLKFPLRNLKELILTNYQKTTDLMIDEANFDNLECLQVFGDEGCKMFSNCKSLKYLIYPDESDFNSFTSEKIILTYLKYEQSITMRPRPIKYLALQGSTSSLDCIDLTQYSYESIITLHLDQMILNNCSNESQEIIKSSCWNDLKCLRLSRLLLKNPRKDLTWILSKCPDSLEILELVSIPLSGLNDFDTNENGIWLIELIFKSFPKLKHLILGDLTIGPSAVNLLMKKIVSKQLKRLKVFGFVQIQTTLGSIYEQSLSQTFRSTYPWTYLILNYRQYKIYSKEFNLFKSGKLFLTI